MANFVTVTVLTLFLALCTFYISAENNCLQDSEQKVCIETNGFYYRLGNGTWNISLTEGDSPNEREAFIKYLESTGCGVDTAAPENETNMDGDYCYCKLVCNMRFPKT